MRAELGSQRWGEETQGRLTIPQSLLLAARAVPNLAALVRTQIVMRTHLARGTGRADLPALLSLDTALTQAARHSVQDRHRSASIIAHVYRTACFAFAISAKDHIDLPRPELLWCACLLHDIALEQPHAGRCFAVRGGVLAAEIARNAGASEGDAQCIGDAVCRHPAPGIDPRRHPLAYLVSVSAILDVTGQGLERLDPGFVSAVNEQYPRDGFRQDLIGLWATESTAVPHGRAHLARCLGFTAAARVSPFV